MTEKDKYFHKIDMAIFAFLARVGFSKNMKVSYVPHSDWLLFEWREISWTENNVKYSISIFPSFNKKEQISGWNFSASASYDKDNNRYFTSTLFAENTAIENIAEMSEELFNQCYQYLIEIKVEEIPFAVEISKTE